MMHPFASFIVHQGPRLQLYWFLCLFLLCWNLENAVGFMASPRKWKHLSVNLPFVFTNLPGQLLLGFFFARVMHWTGNHHFGLIRGEAAESHPLLAFLAVFLLLDLGEYGYHVIMHKVKRLWMFHMVHHSDPSVDITTTLREHPGENLIRLSFTLLWVFISGAALWMLLLRQLIQAFSTLVAHINYRLPDRTDRVLGWIFITPNLHQVHHHFKQPYTDCNYGDVLSIWDRLFGTFRTLPADELVFGVDACADQVAVDDFRSLLVLPLAELAPVAEPGISNA